MASPHRSAEPVRATSNPTRWLRLSLLSGSLSAAVLTAALVLGWGPVTVTASATVLLMAALYAVFWFAELDRPLPGSSHLDADLVR